MKRVLLVAGIFAALTVSLMAGGGKQSGGTAGSAYKSTGKQDPFGKYTPEITLTSTRIMSPNDKFEPGDPEKRSYEENRWMRIFKEELGINIKYKWISPDADSHIAKWNANIASGDIPDFADVSDSLYKQLYDADYIADMGQILQDYATPEFLSIIEPSDYDMMTMDGKMLGFPAGRKALNAATVLFIRQDWLDRVKLPRPETVDDVIKIARAFKAANLGGNETIGLLLSNNFNGGSTHALGDGKWDGFLNAYGAYINYWLEKDGKLVYSSVQPEWRPALLKLQELYRDGTINKDFAVVNTTVAREYVASGKVGIIYSNASAVIHGINTLVKTDKNARIINVFPPPLVKGQKVKVQTNSPKGFRMFVSNKTKYPEAVVKLANLSYKGKFEDYHYYIEDEAGFPYYKMLPWNDFFAPANDDFLKSDAMRQAELSGSKTPLADASWQANYDGYLLAKEGKSEPWSLNLYGPNGSFSTLFDHYNAGDLLLDGYSGVPTDTMTLKGGIINAALQTAVYEVVMGADISVFDRAVQKWYSDGGTQIVDEVNKWYQGLKKK
jgi:putative aldouronate transport system substrate-binding protein